VHVRPSIDAQGHAVVIIELHSLHGTALVQARACDLQRFVHRMTSAVRPGDEPGHMNVDATVAAILVPDPSE
ncbi:MAG: SsgA family sporulation/cell division regulator, partial [Pseudonocardia sp.]